MLFYGAVYFALHFALTLLLCYKICRAIGKCIKCALADGNEFRCLLDEIEARVTRIGFIGSCLFVVSNVCAVVTWSGTHHALRLPPNLSHGRFQLSMVLNGMMLGFGLILLGLRISLTLLSALHTRLQVPQKEQLPLLYKSSCRVLELSIGLIFVSALAALVEAFYYLPLSTTLLYLAFICLATYHYIRTR